MSEYNYDIVVLGAGPGGYESGYTLRTIRQKHGAC